MAFRILLVTDTYPPLFGGATRDTHLLAIQLARRGHEVHVVTPWQAGLSEQEDADGVSVYRLKGWAVQVRRSARTQTRRVDPPLPDPGDVWTLRRLIKKVRPDIVHSYGWITYSCAVALLGTKVPLLLSARDYGNVCALRTLIYHGPHGQSICTGPALTKCLACAARYYDGMAKTAMAVGGVLGGRPLLRRKMHGLHSCGTYVQEVMRRDLLSTHGRGQGKTRLTMIDEVIPSFRDESDDGVPDQTILARLPVEPFILFAGALRLPKGLEPLFAAYQRLESPPPLVLMGSLCPDTPKEFPPATTVLLDVPHATLMAAWERALFGVAPSLVPETFGNVVHEAMSKGKAMIGTVPGGHADQIVDGESGLLVPAGDVTALTEAMQRLIGDAPLRERLGRAARERAQLFTVEAVMPRFEALYERVVRASHEASRPRGYAGQVGVP